MHRCAKLSKSLRDCLGVCWVRIDEDVEVSRRTG